MMVLASLLGCSSSTRVERDADVSSDVDLPDGDQDIPDTDVGA